MNTDTSDDTLPPHRGPLLAAALPTLLAAALLWWLVSPSAAQTAGGRRSQLASTVDASINPGDDFFAYANGSWLKATTIPAGNPRWGARDELEALARRRIMALIDAAGAAP